MKGSSENCYPSNVKEGMLKIKFNKDISGYENEGEFAAYLNGKRVGEVNPIFQDLLSKLYKNLSDDDYIKCWVNMQKRKADIYIKINNYVRGISIKKGVKNSVHVEHIDDFIWITREEIKYIIRKHLSDNVGALHISCLTIQPKARNLNYNTKHESGRRHVQLKWYNLSDQIIEVMATYRDKNVIK